MGWQLGLSRFIHGFTQDAPLLLARPAMGSGLDARAALGRDREERLLPALIEALFDTGPAHTAWPPRRVSELLDLAGLDHADTALHLQGPCLPASFFKGALSRGGRHTLLLQGLATLDAGLQAQAGALFDELSPALRGYVLGAFERGELGCPQHEAERFMDGLIETVTFALLNCEAEADIRAPGASAWRPQDLR
ncbi:MAG: hypothetical protein E6Q67_02285 [Roseateles sp.]|nr:MAG: hypothetical protein E6Q67_02285 [Roseateles sp.]